MKILVGKCFGIGNAVLSVPMIKALSSLGQVDVLVGSLPCDFGAYQVMDQLVSQKILNKVYIDFAPDLYDVAVMAIPFDGRWKNGVHFFAKGVMDLRPRPNFSSQLGFDSWKKHEVEYQMENAFALGYSGKIPSTSFLSTSSEVSDQNLIYVGLGFKRDQDSFWAKKHWGNDRFIRFVDRVRSMKPEIKFVSTGSVIDIAGVIAPIIARSIESWKIGSITSDLTASFFKLAGCAAYFGNDTGMMHVAASLDKPTYGLMAFPNVATKNRPWCSNWDVHDFSSGISDPDDVAEDFLNFLEESKR